MTDQADRMAIDASTLEEDLDINDKMFNDKTKLGSRNSAGEESDTTQDLIDQADRITIDLSKSVKLKLPLYMPIEGNS